MSEIEDTSFAQDTLNNFKELTEARLNEINERLVAIAMERDKLLAEHATLLRGAKSMGIMPRRSHTANPEGRARIVDHIINVLEKEPMDVPKLRYALAGIGVHFKTDNTLCTHLTLLKREKKIINNSGIWSTVTPSEDGASSK